MRTVVQKAGRRGLALEEAGLDGAVRLVREGKAVVTRDNRLLGVEVAKASIAPRVMRDGAVQNRWHKIGQGKFFGPIAEFARVPSASETLALTGAPANSERDLQQLPVDGKFRRREQARRWRLAHGAKPHSESLSQTKPWLAEGISRRTWERRRAAS